MLANHLPRFLSPQLQFYLEEGVKGEAIGRERDLHFLCRDESRLAVRVGEVEDSQLQIVSLQRMGLALVLQPTITHPNAPVRAQSSLLNSHAPINMTLKRVTMVMLCSKNHFQSYLHKAVRQVWIQLNNLKICHSLPYTSCPRWMRYTGPTFLP